MAQSKHQIESLLAQARSRPRHQFGQNFMIDQNLVRAVAEAGQLGPGDCAIEVGPGTGTLTEELLDRAGQVVVVEIDRDLARLLRTTFAGRERFALIEGDALAGKHDLNPALLDTIARARGDGLRVKLVANLPYNIASPLVIEMLIAGVELLAFTVQKEVAQRLAAKPGTDEYGPLTVMAQMLARVELLRTLSPQAFWPPPKIDSSLVRLTRDDRLGPMANAFSRFVHTVFSFRRKTLRRALAQAGYDADRVLSATGLDGQRRAEEFAPEVFVRMFEAAEGNQSGDARPLA
ncbi:MAG TPA: 16S rRNA (adenine(1518)-N(6)/adenine(1519)-N(6))-dimethyltransferase RsmA [Tepidisphaeraceae bacterium]|jgi:16S rRNA (adenine1518-N6/adenine1519-N6)-dimethyltransferase